VTIGRGAYVDAGVVLGNNCKVQNQALIYEPAHLADGVFVGPGAILTNDRHPRAVTPALQKKSQTDWTAVGVSVAEGAAIGAGSVVIAPARIGSWALVGAGSVVTRDVPDFAVVMGSPARRTGWVGRAGVALVPTTPPGDFLCPVTSARYRQTGAHELVEVTDE
jgi:acetyltransferase-like isoleucine patch superfamily enzyme